MCFLVMHFLGVFMLCRLVCKIQSGVTELFQPVAIMVQVYEGKVEGLYSINGEAVMEGFSFVVMLVVGFELSLGNF